MHVDLIDYYGSDLSVVNAARVSMGKQTKEMRERDGKLIKYLWTHKHWSPFEHAGFTFRVKVPIFVARQIMRHRSHAFNEISGRYVEFQPEFYLPPVFREQDKDVKQGSKDEQESNVPSIAGEYYAHSVNESYKNYQMLLELGVCKEQARAVLPLCLLTEFIQTVNLRSFIHFIQLRADGHTQHETRIIADTMLQLVKDIPDNPFQYSLGALCTLNKKSDS